MLPKEWVRKLERGPYKKTGRDPGQLWGQELNFWVLLDSKVTGDNLWGVRKKIEGVPIKNWLGF